MAALLRLCDPERVARFSPQLARALEADHAPQDWPLLVRAVQQMYQELSRSPALDWGDLRAITQPALIVSGDRDQMVSEEETRRVHAALPEARLLMFPGYAHPFASVPLPLLWAAVRDWLAATASRAVVG